MGIELSYLVKSTGRGLNDVTCLLLRMPIQSTETLVPSQALFSDSGKVRAQVLDQGR